MGKMKLVLILVVLLGASVFTQGFTSFSLGGSSASKAKQAADEFIAKNLMVGQEDAYEITDIVKEKGLYKLTVDLQGQEITSYMTEDQSMFFPSAMNMNPENVAGESAQAAQQPEDIPQSDNPTVQLYTMTFCPYGNQAEELMRPVADLLGDAVEIEPHYIFYDNYQGGGPEYCLDDESQYCSMHGVGEANQDIRELCVYNNQQEKYWDFVEQVNQDCVAEDVDQCWQDAAQEVGVNVSSVESCFEDNKLAYAEDEVGLASEYNVTGSPTLLINGVNYTGDRSAQGYKDAICSAFNEAPEACNQDLEVEEDTASAPAGSCN